MRYIIHNKHLIVPENQQAFFQQEVEKKIALLEKILAGYKKDLLLEVFIKKNENHDYHLAVSIRLKSKWLLQQGSGPNPFFLVNELLDKLRNRIKDQLSIERREYIKKRRHHSSQTFIENIDTLTKLHQGNEYSLFEHIVKTNLPLIRNYIKRRLKFAKHKGLAGNALISADDLLNEVFLKAFELYSSRPDEQEAFVPWLYQLADEIVEKHVQETALESANTQSLSELEKATASSMEENFTADADGDLVMLEELDDPSYQSKYYHAEELLKGLVDDEMLKKIEKMDIDQTHNKICYILAGQPVLKRTIFDLYWLEGFDQVEISKIKSVSIAEVQDTLEEVRSLIVNELALWVSQSS
jgi:RNA polymerase sigma factor (sigma-70 family)